MAVKDESPPGLLSKVVRMVRNPAAPWTGDDGDEGDPDSGMGKQALKEMMERRRRNDFVRKREFDQLRRTRRTGVVSQANGSDTSRISGLDSSYSSRQHDREGTLRKIDEIEEQMSRQWWKSRPAGLVEQRSLKPNDNGPHPGRRRTDRPSAPRPGDAAPDYQNSGHGSHTGFAPTAPGSIDASGALEAPDLELPDAAERPAEILEIPAGTLRLQAIASLNDALPEYVHDAALDDAAIRFANADFPGAEQALRSLLDEPATAGAELAWSALFDFYRASGRHDRYEAVAIDFAERFGRSPPAWFSLAAEDQQALGLPDAPGLQWRCPAQLGAAELASLSRRTDSGVQPWLFDWTALEALRDDAAAPLLAAISRWSKEPLSLRFIRVDRLTHALRARSPDNEANVAPAWWQIRMELLRLLRQPDEFERVALDYCITYEVSPPSWQRAVCECTVVSAEGVTVADARAPADAPSTFVASDFALSMQSTGFSTALPAEQVLSIPAAALSGDVVGDADAALAGLDAALQQSSGAAALVIDCDRLARLDFAAAGSLLNWAAERHGEGVHLQFRSMHRLLAAFATVVGIQEFARLHIRAD